MAKKPDMTPPPRVRSSRPPSQMRKLRAAKGLTQLDLAALVGVTPNYLAMLERSPSCMTTTVAGKVAEILGCSVDEIRS